MGRPERHLDPDGGPLQRFALELRALRVAAGRPSYRQLSKRARFSVTALSEAAGGEVVPSLAVTLAYVQACGADAVAWEARWRELVGVLASAPPGDRDASPAPYLGLATFEQEDAERYFGRARIVERLCDRLAEESFLVLFAPSGAGKSSLLRAGLLPRLVDGPEHGPEHGLEHGPEHGRQSSDTQWQPVVLTPGERPVETLAIQLANIAGVAAASVLATLRADPASIGVTIRQAFTRRPGHTTIIIVVDQFEEIFTHCREERERAGFVAMLIAAAAEPRTRVVLGVRADFYARCASYPELVAMLHGDLGNTGRGQVLLGPMDDDDLRQVIIGPARRAGLTVEPALVEVAVADARGQPGALPLLSHALLETWRRREGNRLTLAGYHAVGGVKTAIARTAERVFGELDAIEQQLAREIFLRLTALGEGTEDTRRRAAPAELLGGPDAPAVARVLALLTTARLITVDDGSVTVAHEALIQEWPRLRGWLAEDRDGLRARRRLSEAATEWSQHRVPGGPGEQSVDGFLFRGARLAAWEGRSTDRLNDVERAFLAASRALEARERRAARRRSRRALAALGATVVVVSLLAGAALMQAARARDERDLARSQQLTAEARNQLQLDPQAALDLAFRAYTIRPTIEAELVLRQAVADHRTRAIVRVDSGPALGVAFSPDGRRLAATGADGLVAVWSWTGESVTGRPMTLRGHVGQVWSPVFSPDGQRLATAGSDGTIRVWRVDAGTAPIVLRGHTGPVWAVAFSPDGRRIASAGEDATVRIWDVDDTTKAAGEPTILRGHEKVTVGVVFSGDGRKLASTSHDGTVRVWDLLDTRAAPNVLRGPQAGTKTVLFTPDGRRLVSSSSDGTTWVWPVDGPGTPLVLRGHQGTVEGLAISPDGRWFATTSDDTTVRVWNATGAGNPLILRGHTHTVWSVAFSPDGSRLASASEDGTIRIWDPRGAGDPIVMRGPAGAVWTAVFTPDGQHVLSAGEDHLVRRWDLSGGSGPVPVGAHDDEVFALRTSRDGRRVASASRDGTIRIWDLAGSGGPVVLRGHDGPAWIGDFSPDGRLVASAGRDGTLRIWSAAGDRPALVRRVESGQLRYARFSPDGKHVATAGADGTVRIWDTTGSAEPTILRGHQGFVWAVAYSPDGRSLASAGVDGTVRIWSITGEHGPLVLRGHHGFVWYVSFSPDGRWLASSGKDGTVHLWRTAEAGPPVTYGGFGASVETVEFSPDGARLVTTHDDGTVRVWRCDACDPIERVLATSRALGIAPR